MFIVSIMLLLAFPLGISAQKQVVKGRVALFGTSQKADILPYANISLMQLPDSTFTQGTVSDEQGKFIFSFLRKPGVRYLIKVSYTGCTSVYQSIPSKPDTIQLGTIKLKDNPLHLKEIVVTAPLKPMEQKGDTTIYNAGAYPTPEGAYLEELVKRIPGLTYDSKDQTITYNGHTIKEITVNGKDFFKGNQQVVLENLPAKFISQLKVYDKPTKEEEATGIKSTEKNYVLDLQTKRKSTMHCSYLPKPDMVRTRGVTSTGKSCVSMKAVIILWSTDSLPTVTLLHLTKEIYQIPQESASLK